MASLRSVRLNRLLANGFCAGAASEAVEPLPLQARLGLTAAGRGASEASDGAVRCRLLGDHSSHLGDALPEPGYRGLWLMVLGHAVLELLEFEQ